MMKKIIRASEKDKWISDIKELNKRIPVNCIFDKGITGCGGTELALTNDIDTIIAVPYVSLIRNKESQEKHKGKILGIYDRVGYQEIAHYLLTHELKKVVLTYDALPKFIDTCKILNIDVYNKFFLLVDEWHILFNSYIFRNSAITDLLKHARLFKEVTYMTATPIEQKYMLKELKYLPIVELVWPNIRKVTIDTQQTNIPANYVCSLINDLLNEKLTGNLHFFVNSVDFISKVLKQLKLNSELVKVVCSQNTTVNQKKLGKKYLIEESQDKAKRINFYTSTCFEGCDIFDEEGRTYIVSDGNRAHTLLDISTLVIQICGRIRNSIYKNNIQHIFSKTRYNDSMTFEDYEQKASLKFKESKEWVEWLNSAPDKVRNRTIDKSRISFQQDYIIEKENNHLSMDKNLMNLDIVNYKITRGVYSSRIALIREYEDKGFDAKNNSYKYYDCCDRLFYDRKSKVSLKVAIEKYAELRLLPEKEYITKKLQLLEENKPLIRQAYEILGIDKIKELKYSWTSIKREIAKELENINLGEIKQQVMMKIGYDEEVKVSLTKKILKDIYAGLNINKKVTTSVLNELFPNQVREDIRKLNNKSFRVIIIKSA